MTAALIIVSILLLGAVIACVWLIAERRSLRRENSRIADDTAQWQQRADSANSELSALRTQIELAEERRKAAEHILNQAEKTFKDAFDALAGKALKGSSDQFLQLAKQVFESEQGKAQKHLDAHRQSIESLIKPVRDTLDQYNQSLRQIEKARHESYSALVTQLNLLKEDQQGLRSETANLVRALRRPEVRGQWGEMQLKRVAELAGMIERCDFDLQPSISSDGRTQRPDMIVNLPSDRTIVVDAKTPLDAFLEATEADDEQRGPLLERHANHILTQVHNLSKKEYIKQLPRTPDFVVLFIPGESFLQAAVQVRPDLLEEAMELNVVIATPTTLISLLKAVAVGWREQQLAENAQRISQTGEELYRRLTTMFGHLASLRKALMSTNDHFNKLIGSLESNVLPQARRFEQLGAATDKTIEATPQIEVIPRQINAALPSGKPDEQPEDRSA